jgi:hypothetical protein
LVGLRAVELPIREARRCQHDPHVKEEAQEGGTDLEADREVRVLDARVVLLEPLADVELSPAREQVGDVHAREREHDVELRVGVLHLHNLVARVLGPLHHRAVLLCGGATVQRLGGLFRPFDIVGRPVARVLVLEEAVGAAADRAPEHGDECEDQAQTF